MTSQGRIITIGLAPAWDVSCRGRALDWGRHQEIDEQVVRPAGKALNVSSALAWMGCESMASGLWGREDYEAMRGAVGSMGAFIRIEMTPVEGRTRQNFTLVDTQNGREMHLRFPNYLVTSSSLALLTETLERLVRSGDTCVFAGAMPGGDLLDSVIALVELCVEKGARIVVDTYGPALKRLVEAGRPWLIAPNVAELSELVGEEIKDTPGRLVIWAMGLLKKVPNILVSRGRKGAVLVTRRGVWIGQTTTKGKVLETVGCGDYLLAGFLAGYRQSDNPRTALTTALKTATARAFAWTETKAWPAARRTIELEVERL